MCHIFCLVIVTEVGVWENKKCCGNTCQRASVFTALFLSSPKLQKPVDMLERKFIWFWNKQKMALKHTDQDSVSLKPCIIHANEMWLYLFHRDKTSVTIEPMDGDFYNNNMNNTKPGIKRRAVDDLQSGISQVNFKLMASNGWTCNRWAKIQIQYPK